jgi:plastocyanin
MRPCHRVAAVRYSDSDVRTFNACNPGNYVGGQIDMNRLSSWCLTTVGLCMALLPGIVSAQAPRTVRQWQVTVGAESRTQAIQANAFVARTINVNVGHSVTWTNPNGEAHTVAFLSGGPQPLLFLPGPNGTIRPNLQAFLPVGSTNYNGTAYVNSGFLQQGQAFTLMFERPGDFAYLCLIHSGMVGAVHVAPASTPYPHNQDFYDDASNRQRDRLLDTGSDLRQDGVEEVQDAGRNQVNIVGELLPDVAGINVDRFLPQQRRVHIGQTVTWINRDPTVRHTITFGPEPPNSPLGAFEPSGRDAPGQATIGAVGQAANSGFLGVNFPNIDTFGTTFQVTFSAPGTYPYICALHDTLGMTGTIQVVP